MMADPVAPPYLTDAEVDEICAGYRQNAAKLRYLKAVVGVPVKRKPNGRPLVLRADVERRAPAADAERDTFGASNQPNWSRKA